MATVARRPCPYWDEGCNWQTPECIAITTVNEAEVYMSSHSYKCIYNPAVVEGRRHRRRLEAADMLQRVAAEETEAARCIEVAEIQEQAEAKEQRQFWDQRATKETQETAAFTVT